MARHPGAPELAHDLDVLARAPGAALEGNAEGPEFLGRPADADPEGEAPLGEAVEAGDGLGQDEGLCSGTRQMPVARRMRLVTAAANVSATKGSSQSASAPSGKAPLGEYG